MHSKNPRAARITAAAASILLIGVALTACVGSGDAASGPNVIQPADVTDDADATLTIWTDGTRQAGFEAYQAANPDVKMDIVTIDNSQILNKIQLANKSKSDWPDVIYPLTTSYTPLLASEAYDYFLQPLDNLIEQPTLDGFGTTLEACTVDGHLYCLRNDIAPSVLYYNTATFAEFGYDVPTTMDEYLALAEDLAANHPDYVAQAPMSVPAQAIVNNFYASSGCPYAEDLGDNKIKIDLNDASCTRVTDLLDTLIADGTFPLDQFNEAQQTELGSSGKLAMSINANWYADYIWAGGFGWPEGELGVAPSPQWADDASYNGAEGGGGYVVSSHSENLKAALDIITFMSAEPDYQLTAGTLPAFEPLREEWGATAVANNPLYNADADPLQVYLEAGANISPALTWIRFEPQNVFTDTIMPALKEGQTIASQIDAWQSALENAAKKAGYTVVTE